MQTAYQQTHLRNLREGFGIDTTPAQNLSGSNSHFDFLNR